MDTVQDNEIKGMSQDISIEVRNLHVWWADENRLILKDLSFQVKKNELYAIAGSVGSGKSTLLVTLLNEVKTFKGSYR